MENVDETEKPSSEIQEMVAKSSNESTNTTIGGCLKINPTYLPLKLLYFFLMAAESSCILYQTIFMRHLGLSTSQVGLITATQRILGIFIPPVCGAIADKTGKPKTFLISVLLASAVLVFSMVFVPIEEKSLHLSAGLNSSENFSYSTLSYNNTAIPEPHKEDEFGATFWLMMTLSALTAFTFNGSTPVVEATTFSILGPKNKHKYGYQRLWASVGFSSAALLLGFLKDLASEVAPPNSNISYLPVFIGSFIFLFLSALLSYKLPISTMSTDGVELSQITVVLKDPRLGIFLLLIVFPFGWGLAALFNYTFWYAEDKLNASSTLLGLSSAMGSLVDIPCFLASGHLIRRFGYNPLLIFSMVMLTFRLYLTVLLTEAWQLIPTEILRGVVWGLAWAVICSYGSHLGPPKLRATTMGLVFATSHGIGLGTGALACGHIYQTLGQDQLFIVSACLTGASTALYAAISLLMLLAKRKNTKTREGATTKL